MSLRKFGTGEVLPENDDMKKTSSKEERDRVIKDVLDEDQKDGDE